MHKKTHTQHRIRNVKEKNKMSTHLYASQAKSVRPCVKIITITCSYQETNEVASVSLDLSGRVEHYIGFRVFRYFRIFVLTKTLTVHHTPVCCVNFGGIILSVSRNYYAIQLSPL